MTRKALTTRDDFDYWVAAMDDALSRFLQHLAPDVREQLDYTPESLGQLEQWILGKYPGTQAMLAQGEAETVDGAARYIGETYRKALGGYWDIRLDDPKFAFYGLPICTGFAERPTPICPITLATAAADRRTGSFLRAVLNHTLRRVEAAGRRQIVR